MSLVGPDRTCRATSRCIAPGASGVSSWYRADREGSLRYLGESAMLAARGPERNYLAEIVPEKIRLVWRTGAGDGVERPAGDPGDLAPALLSSAGYRAPRPPGGRPRSNQGRRAIRPRSQRASAATIPKKTRIACDSPTRAINRPTPRVRSRTIPTAAGAAPGPHAVIVRPKSREDEESDAASSTRIDRGTLCDDIQS